ncbi:nucleolar and spindle-associated protein 1-A-like isoform X2 [Penaeus chinensis]|uniref:nucleolar and spindle-associated protein 1-A-like isoform X2 n=1 Tax=Penaeus chinensis TaxID=139456 RepID=UPI001FB6189D|nr:nucleolar and spindle-associated protein 1-A-like isoform X2 [Penaeus chinensis]
MEMRIYTEEELRAMKYGGLLKIIKSRALKTTGKKLKTEKLIEMILESQTLPDMTDDVAAVCAALDTDSQTGCAEELCGSEQVTVAGVVEADQQEELLDDIEFPEEPSPDPEPSKEMITTRRRGRPKRKQSVMIDAKDDITHFDDIKEEEPKIPSPEETLTEIASLKQQQSVTNDTTDNGTKPGQSRKRRRTRTFDIEEKTETTEEEKEKELAKAPAKRSRTSTFEIAEPKEEGGVSENRQPKLRRSSTFDLASKESDNQSVSEKAEESDPEPRRVSRRRSSIKKADEVPEVQQTSSVGSKPVETQKVDNVTAAVASPRVPQKNTPRLSSIAKRKSLVITPAATPPVIHKVKSMILGSGKTLGSGSKTGGGAKIVKPVFTVGRGDGPSTKNVGKDSKQDGSNIPRFLSYVRKPRVPNFAKIHERAFNRMEALDDYVDKKRKRTNTFGSSVKKPQVDPEKVFKPAVTSVKNLNLNFVATRSPARFGKTPVGNKEPKTGNTTKTPKSGPSLASKSPREVKAQSKAIPAKSPKSAKKSPKVAVTSTKKPKGPHKSPKVPAQKSPKAVRPSPKAGQSQEGMKVAPASSKKVSPKSRVSALPRLLKENVKPARPSLVSPAVAKVASVKMPQSPASSKKTNESSSKIPASRPTGYVPYRGALKPFTDRATLNKMAERNPNLKSREQIREGHKKILKGVRFNKRFELQMAKRGINLS